MAFFVLVLIVVFVLFFTIFQKRKNQLIIDRIEQEKKFEEELVRTQQEIQEETLKHVGRELHDNVGQMLALASMQMKAVSRIVDDEVKTKVDNASEALKETLTEVRTLSKSLNSDVIFNLGFEAVVKNEIERLNKTGLIQSSIAITGNKVNFENEKDETILFRILQEFSSNTLKYAEAEHLNISINYFEDKLEISIEDDGSGFDLNTVEKGSGLINMEKRAELINTNFQLESQLNKGTILHLVYPYRTL
ncbi:two-component sensor histidine kinase [Winogradskyella sp. PG-2]|nr:two-component sensor histidine kinase [Winogradskyella sp. PG-2]